MNVEQPQGKPLMRLLFSASVLMAIFSIFLPTSSAEGEVTTATSAAYFEPSPGQGALCPHPTFFPPMQANQDEIGSVDLGFAETVYADGRSMKVELVAEGQPGATYPTFASDTDKPKGFELQAGDAVELTFDQPLAYVQVVNTDVDRRSEGFVHIPRWYGEAGGVAGYGGDENFTFEGSALQASFDDTDTAAHPSEAIEGRVQMDYFGLLSGLRMERNPDSSGQSGFAVAGGCRPIVSTKRIDGQTPSEDGGRLQVVYDIQVINNMPTQEALLAAMGSADFQVGEAKELPIYVRVNDPLPPGDFDSASIDIVTDNGVLDLNAAYDGETDPLVASGVIAPGEKAIIQILANYSQETPTCDSKTVHNQASVEWSLDGENFFHTLAETPDSAHATLTEITSLCVPTPTPTPSPTSTPVPSPTSTPVPSPTSTPVPSPTSTPVPSPTSTPVPSPTATPVAVEIPTPLAQTGAESEALGALGIILTLAGFTLLVGSRRKR